MGNVNLKLIPDWVSLQQYFTVLLKSPDYLFKLGILYFWCYQLSYFQLVVGCMAAYGFANTKGKGYGNCIF